MSVIDENGATGAVGFWSYAHKDDEQVKGRIVRLAGEISDAYSLLTGDDLEMFLDRKSLEWGAGWRGRIDQALQETTFFIPIVTPRYFGSQECRNELLKFSGHAQSLGADELLLPILFVDVDDLVEGSPDEAKALIAKTQYEDWRELRMMDEASEPYLRAVNKLAKRLVQIGKDYATKPTVIPEEMAVAAQAHPAVDEEPGVLDLIAEMEANLPLWGETIKAFPEPMQQIGALTQEAAQRMDDGNKAGKGFAHKVLVARQLAEELKEPASELLELGEKYATQLVDVDPGVRALISLAGSSTSPEDREGARSAFEALLSMVESSRQNVAALSGLSESMRLPAKQSRDLRPVLGNIESGLRGVLDGQTIMDEWERLIRESDILGDGEGK